MAAQSITFWVGLRSLCADISQQKSGLPATFFLHTKKEGKDVPRGVPPLGSPGSLPAFSLGKPAGGRTPEPAYIQKRGCGPGAWVAIKSWVDIPPPGTGRLHIRPPYRLIRSAQTVFPAPAGSVQNRPDARGGSTGYRRFGAPAPPSGAARRGG